MLGLAAFADEISPDLDEQIRVCKANGVTHFELRGVFGKNVMDLDSAEKSRIRSALSAANMGVISIGSPIGKVAIDEPWPRQFDTFKKAVEIAEFFNAPLLRVFSYYPPGGEGRGPVDPMRGEVIDRFAHKVQYLASHPVTLVHENEKGIFGDTGARCLALLASIQSNKLQAAFDAANFVQVGEDPWGNWQLLKPYVRHIHIKDALAATKAVVPAGKGDARLPQILADAYAGGYRGFLSLEPHLKLAGHSHGETGPELFAIAATALKTVCETAKIPLAPAP